MTLLLPDRPVVMGCDVRGGGPGTRETDALEPSTLVERVHGLVLAGGSVFGLEAASETALLLARDGIGLPVTDEVFVPVLPSAILFDLANGGDKPFARGESEAPYRALAEAASAKWLLLLLRPGTPSEIADRALELIGMLLVLALGAVLNTGAVKRGEVELGPVAVALKATKAAAVLRNVKVA